MLNHPPHERTVLAMMKRQWASVMTGLAMLALFVGCDTVSFKGSGTRGTVAAEQWPFAPVSMRVHPFTSLEDLAAEEAVVLEARLELLDQTGDVTKGVGDWRFELYADGRPGRGSGEARRRLSRWEAAMTSLEQNERHYDPITRTYAFRLRVTEQLPTDRPLILVAQLTDPQGQRLLAEGEVEYAGRD